MAQRPKNQFLTSRLRILVATGLTALFLAVSIRGLVSGHTGTHWLISPSGLLHGVFLISVNVALYCYICWIGFLVIRDTGGRERVFALGWCLSLFLWPVRMFWPQMALPIRHIGAFGMAVALFAGVAMLLEPSETARSGGTTDQI